MKNFVKMVKPLWYEVKSTIYRLLGISSKAFLNVFLVAERLKTNQKKTPRDDYLVKKVFIKINRNSKLGEIQE